MPRQTLKTASKARAKTSAKRVASKIVDTPKATTSASNSAQVGNSPSNLTSKSSSNLDVSQHKTVTDASKAIHDKAGMDEKLKQSEISAEKARQETVKKQGELNEFQKQLGAYVIAK